MSLSHYDLFTAFNLVDAAHLAAGVEPQLRFHDTLMAKTDALFKKSVEVNTILEAMRHGVQGAICNVPNSLYLPKSVRNLPDWALIPTSMVRFLNMEPPCFPTTEKCNNWLLEIQSDANEENFIFDRVELHRWFGKKGIGFKPKYEFVKSGDTTPLEEPLKEELDALPIADKILGTRERDTLLTIIAALCNEAKMDYTKHAKTAGMIQSTAAKMGLSIGESTIEGHLKRIPNALAGRMK